MCTCRGAPLLVALLVRSEFLYDYRTYSSAILYTCGFQAVLLVLYFQSETFFYARYRYPFRRSLQTSMQTFHICKFVLWISSLAIAPLRLGFCGASSDVEGNPPPRDGGVTPSSPSEPVPASVQVGFGLRVLTFAMRGICGQGSSGMRWRDRWRVGPGAMPSFFHGAQYYNTYSDAWLHAQRARHIYICFGLAADSAKVRLRM